SKNPAGRPASAAAVVAELDAIARSGTAPPVVVVWHPTAASAPAAPDPWSNLESTEASAVVARKPRPQREPEEEDEDEAPRRRSSRRADPDDEPRSFKWVWIGGGTALAAVL